MAERLILFDIDGTLLETKGAGRQAFIQTLADVFGIEDDIAYIRFAGNTDLNVLRQFAAHHGIAIDSAALSRFLERLPHELAQRIEQAETILMDGVMDVLRSLDEDATTHLGLVTGNIEACARIKLERFDLNRFFPLGGFGEDGADRRDIAHRALERHRRKHGVPSRVCLVGDSPADIQAARAIGARAIGVTTGRFTAADLSAAGATCVLPGFSDLQATLQAFDHKPYEE